MEDEIAVSKLNHTWIIDLDGTILKHNGYILDGKDSFLPEAYDFLQKIPQEDMLIFLTSRKEEYRQITERFLSENDINYDLIIFNAPYGERILLNDLKSSGMKTAISVNVNRDEPHFPQFVIDETL